MRSLRAQLLATAAVTTLSGSAFAADMGPPVKAPLPAPIPYAQFQGWYIGGAIGAARLNVTANQTFGSTGNCGSEGAAGTTSSCATSATGFTAGVQVGYDWQTRYFVYGAVADWTWTGLKHTTTNHAGGAGTSSIPFITAKVDWLATFRGRMGLAVDDTLIYMTGGLALADIKSSVGRVGCSSSFDLCSNALSTVQAGWVAGVGAEHKFTQNWSVFTEFLYYDLGHASASSSNGSGFSTDFFHEIFQGKIGVNYRF
jgi:outer membrane immunogenic protein